MVILDRILHVIPLSTLTSCEDASAHVLILDGIAEIVNYWVTYGMAARVSSNGIRNTKSIREISKSTLLSLFGSWLFPIAEQEINERSRCIALTLICRIVTIKCQAPMQEGHAAQVCKLLLLALSSPNSDVVSTAIRWGNEILHADFAGQNILIPMYTHTIINALRNASLTESDLKSIHSFIIAAVPFTLRYPDISLTSWTGHKANALISNEYLLKDSESNIHYHFGLILTRLLDTKLKSSELKRNCLWGIHYLIIVVLALVDRKGAEVHEKKRSPRALIKNWIITICESSSTSGSDSVEFTALNVLSSLSAYSDALRNVDPTWISHILMHLAVLAQQQIEEASVEIQKIVERNAKKRSAKQPSVIEIDTSRLELIASKTSSTFDTLRVWMMAVEETLLQDPEVSSVIFSAIEAALVGALPVDTPWFQKIQKLNKKESQPLLILGLHMRQSLEQDRLTQCLQCFETMARAAEGLLLHLVRVLNI